jgi:hypothetical protein
MILRFRNWEFQTYPGITGRLVFVISKVNKYGGSVGFADPSLIKVILWWLKENN